MDSGPPARRSELLGPRPAPLKIRKEPHTKLKKPPAAAPPPPPPQRAPVIIYTVSPKVVHTTPGNFMSVVQRLTGGAGASDALMPPPPPRMLPSSSSSSRVDGAGAFSPAARSAAVKSEEEGDLPPGFDGEISGTTKTAGNRRPGTGLFGGILSPGPSSLPWISPSLFTPPPPSSVNMFGELSPLQHGGGGGGGGRSFPEMSSFMAIASPNNTIFPSGAVAPSPTAAGYWDLFFNSQFDD